MKFEDHFSRASEAYARHRPKYPAELFAYLAETAPGRELAWDAATGSGQAAVGLAHHFRRVVATDASAEQIRWAQPHERVTYLVEPAEQPSLETGSADIVTSATAVHWFDHDRFYPEVRRVLKPGGVIAVWAYHRPIITPAVDALIAKLEDDILGGYWPEGKRYLYEHYVTLPFPFDEIDAPRFTIKAAWGLDQALGFFHTWSAVRRFMDKNDYHPVQAIWDAFVEAWGGEGATRAIDYPLYLRVGRV